MVKNRYIVEVFKSFFGGEFLMKDLCALLYCSYENNKDCKE